MTSIDIITPPGTIHIELLDNPFVKKWTEHFSNMLEKFEVNYGAETQPVFNPSKTNQEILTDLENLRNTIIKLQDMGTNFPCNPWKVTYEKIFIDHDVGQQILNEIHRYFTTGERTYTGWDRNIGKHGLTHWSDDFESEFTINKNNKNEFYKQLLLINDYVHELDQSLMTTRKLIDRDKQIVNLQFKFTGGIFADIREEDYMYASDNEEYDVWVGNDILGKDYIEAFYDHDDPSQWDVTCINGHTGRVNINVASQWFEKESIDNSLQKLVKKKHFQDWLKEYNVEYVPQMCGIPLGKVTSGKEFAIRKYFKSVYKQEFQIKVNN